jgi:hypothetical protein
MNVNWVAASVRARNLSQLRVGASRCRHIGTVTNLPEALALLADSSYAQRLVGVTSLSAAQRATSETMLWQLRVLAGWLPPGGTGLVRAIAGIYERDNIVALARHLAGGQELSEAYQLGGLATAWPRLQRAPSLPALTEALRQSAWGVTGAIDAIALRDVLTLAWLRRLAAAAPAASAWACSASVLVAARMVLVDHTVPTSRVLELVRPWIGREWASTRDLDGFRARLPRSARTVLDGIDDPWGLWRAEARMRAEVETDGFRLAHSPLPGPDVVLGAIAVLAVDGWRLRAALAAAEADTGSSEVLDAVA